MNVEMKFAALLFLVCLYVIITESDARGRGGGSRGGGFRGGYRGSYRSYRTTRYTRYTKYRLYRSSTWKVRAKKLAILAGSVYVARKLRMRLGIGYRRYSGSYNFEICRNFRRYPNYNGSVVNVYGWFICPTDNDPMDNVYCCGPDGLQYCCGYWGSPGRVAGLVIGLLVAVGVTIGCVYFCCCRGKKRRGGEIYKRPGEQTVQMQSPPPPPVQVSASAPAPTYPPYGAAQSHCPPPSYDVAAANPYPVNPMPGPGYGAPPPGGFYPPANPAGPGYPTGGPPDPGYPTGPGYPMAGPPVPGYPTEKPPYPS